MNTHDRNLSTPIDPVKLDRLAEVAVKVGLQLKAGQDLLLTAPTAALPLVRRIAEHAYRLSQAFSKFYAACPILQAAPMVRASRLALAQTTLAQLEHALDVLGIAVPERM